MTKWTWPRLDEVTTGTWCRGHLGTWPRSYCRMFWLLLMSWLASLDWGLSCLSVETSSLSSTHGNVSPLSSSCMLLSIQWSQTSCRGHQPVWSTDWWTVINKDGVRFVMWGGINRCCVALGNIWRIQEVFTTIHYSHHTCWCCWRTGISLLGSWHLNTNDNSKWIAIWFYNI